MVRYDSHQDPNTYLPLIAAGNLDLLDQIYSRYRKPFLQWCRFRFPFVPVQDMEDAWEEAMISFYRQIQAKKLTQLTCSVKSFLFLIGRRQLHHIRRKTGNTILTENPIEDHAETSDIREEEAWRDGREQLVRQAIAELPEQARRIVTLRYLDGKSIEEIMQEVGYTSANAVSVTLSRSLRRLQEIIVSLRKETHGTP